MKELKLTKGLVSLVDDEDYEWLSQWKWVAVKGNKTFYASRPGSPIGKRILMHREILGEIPLGLFPDHKDRNGLNNQRNNLRLATRYQNQANRSSFKGSSSKYKGVCFYKGRNVWQAHIRKNGVLMWLGNYKSEEFAAQVYNKAAIEIHGEFANLNPI